MLIRLFGLWVALGIQTLLAGVNNDGDDPIFPHAAPLSSSRTEINVLMRSGAKFTSLITIRMTSHMTQFGLKKIHHPLTHGKSLSPLLRLAHPKTAPSQSSWLACTAYPP